MPDHSLLFSFPFPPALTRYPSSEKLYTICAFFLCLDARVCVPHGPVVVCFLFFVSSFSGDFFIPAFQCPHLVERIGTLGDGGKWVCGLDRVAKQDRCVIYSFGIAFFFIRAHVMFKMIWYKGINGESSFEQSLLQRVPGCEVWGYDFSVKGVRDFFFFNSLSLFSSLLTDFAFDLVGT